MLLAIEQGNTNTLFAVHDGVDWIAQWRAATEASRTADEYAVWLNQLLGMKGLKFEALTGCIISSVVPQSIRTLAPISEPRLDAASATAWYLAASPNQIDTIEYAYLEGQQGAYIETRNGFDVDGVEIKCRLDFGAKAIDWRGLYKNPGA